MKRRPSSGTTTGEVDRQLDDTAYDNVVIVADAIVAVNTVANNIGAINTANGNAGNIATVAADIAAVVATGTNIGSVNTTAGSIANVNTVAGHIANVDTVATSIANVNAVGNSIGSVNTLAPATASINTVATIVDEVYVTAANIDGITIVAADITHAEFDAMEDLGLVSEPVDSNPATGVSVIKTVSDNIVNVNLTGGSITSINATAASISNVNAVATNITSVNLVATTIVPNITEILLADNNAAIATTQASIATTQASIATTKAGEASTSATTAASLLDQFDDRYLGSKALAPTLDNDGNPIIVGALYWDNSSNAMYVWNGSAWDGISSSFTPASVATLTNKTIDSITNLVGANHVHHECRNTSGSTIAAGTVVAAQGVQGGTDYIEIVAVTDPQTQIAIGITHTAVGNNNTGLVVNTGVCVDYTDTSTWAVGTILYPNNAGGLTNTKPTVGQYQACACVLRQHATQGRLLVEFTEPKVMASTSKAGYVQLNDTLTSTSVAQALTAAQGKVLQDGKAPLSHVHGDISNTGTISSAAVTAVNTDYLLISDTSNSNKIQRGVLLGSATTTYLRNDGTWGTPIGTTYSLATASVLGLIKLGSDTVQSVAANAVTTAASRSYAVQVNASGQMVTNIPWTDTLYSLPASVVHDTEAGALHATDALRISGTTLSLYKGDGTFESVTTQDTIYTHPTTDGNLHVPATGTANNGKVLMAGATAGSISWQANITTADDIIATLNADTTWSLDLGGLT